MSFYEDRSGVCVHTRYPPAGQLGGSCSSGPPSDALTIHIDHGSGRPVVVSGLSTIQVATVRVDALQDSKSVQPVQIVFPEFIAAWGVAFPEGTEISSVEAIDAGGTVIKSIKAPK
ncbi:MAG: hypothetical protein ABI725_03890 [Chloroflexota bacterium]